VRAFWHTLAHVSAKYSHKQIVFLNLDETSVGFNMTPLAGCVAAACVQRGLRLRAKVKKENLRGAMSYVALICDSAELQGKLPHYLIGSTVRLTKTIMKGIAALPATQLRILRRKSAWNTSEVMVAIIKDVSKTLQPVLDAGNVQPVLLLDCAPAHLPLPVMQAASDCGIQLLFIPSSCTHIAQPLDIRAFAGFKMYLKKVHRELRAASAEGLISPLAWIWHLTQAPRQFFAAKKWKPSFEAVGAGLAQRCALHKALRSDGPEDALEGLKAERKTLKQQLKQATKEIRTQVAVEAPRVQGYEFRSDEFTALTDQLRSKDLSPAQCKVRVGFVGRLKQVEAVQLREQQQAFQGEKAAADAVLETLKRPFKQHVLELGRRPLELVMDQPDFDAAAARLAVQHITGNKAEGTSVLDVVALDLLGRKWRLRWGVRRKTLQPEGYIEPEELRTKVRAFWHTLAHVSAKYSHKQIVFLNLDETSVGFNMTPLAGCVAAACVQRGLRLRAKVKKENLRGAMSYVALICNVQPVLLLDCAPAHLPLPVMQAASDCGIQLLFIPSSCTHIAQPLDIRAFDGPEDALEGLKAERKTLKQQLKQATKEIRTQ
ncbi:unnamed protein product, partial [Effrenium voratum]